MGLNVMAALWPLRSGVLRRLLVWRTRFNQERELARLETSELNDNCFSFTPELPTHKPLSLWYQFYSTLWGFQYSELAPRRFGVATAKLEWWAQL